MKNTIAVYVFLLLSASVSAQTNVGGGLYANTTWTAAGSPYIVTGKLVIFPDFTLTIEPGVTVKFSEGGSLECRGRLSAIGTETDNIEFTSVGGSWLGITVIGLSTSAPAGQVKMEYCKGMYAKCFIDLDLAYQGPYIFNHCYFYKNEKVNNDGGSVGTYFNYCRFQSNSLALGHVQFGGRVSHSEFFNNRDGVDGFENVDSCTFHDNLNVALSPYGSAKGNIVYDNNIGVRCYFNSANNTFIQNQIYHNNIGVDILSYFNGYINFQQNSICGNKVFNIKNSSINDAGIANNCFCSTDSLKIRAGISDGNKDLSVGLVSFMPLPDSCKNPYEPFDSISIIDTVRIDSTNNNLPDIDSVNSVIPGMKIYPNPVLSNGALNITVDKNITNGVLSIYNLMGTIVYSQKFAGKEKRIFCDLPKGTYLIRVTEGNQKWVKQFYKL